MITLPEQEALIRLKIREGKQPSASVLNTWYSNLIENKMIFVLVDKREQQPLTETELGLPVKDMPTKVECGYLSTGDHPVYIKNHLMRIVFERKGGKHGCDDFYGTLYFGRARFYSEIDRFYQDDRFKATATKLGGSFIILVESSEDDFLNYVPERKACKFCKHYVPNPPIEDVEEIGICTHIPGTLVHPLDKCVMGFEDVETYEFRRDSILNSKKATLNSLTIKPHVKLVWCGSRQGMVETFRDMIRQYCLQNYKEILYIVPEETELGFC